MRRSVIRASRYRNIVYLIVLNNQTSGACNDAGIKMSQLERGGCGVSESLSLVLRHVPAAPLALTSRPSAGAGRTRGACLSFCSRK